MKTSEISFYKHKSKTDRYIRKGRRRWEDLFKSVQYFLDKFKWQGEKVLEIGCAAGGLYEIMKNRYGNFDYTGLDISPAELKVARERYSNAKFICANFYNKKFKANSYDAVLAFLIVSHQRDYKDFISEMIRIARKKVIFDVRLRYDGTTIVDLDTSYLYYHGSGKRNYYVVFNFYELFNFLHLAEFNLKKISVYGYYTPDKTSAFVPMPKSKIIAASFCLEKLPPGEKVERWGGWAERADNKWCAYDIQLPDFSMDDI
jgi:23S rRNA U2552 (ribose-2'-O)-methylase RlmE/FtsJ